MSCQMAAGCHFGFVASALCFTLQFCLLRKLPGYRIGVLQVTRRRFGILARAAPTQVGLTIGFGLHFSLLCVAFGAREVFRLVPVVTLSSSFLFCQPFLARNRLVNSRWQLPVACSR